MIGTIGLLVICGDKCNLFFFVYGIFVFVILGNASHFRLTLRMCLHVSYQIEFPVSLRVLFSIAGNFQGRKVLRISQFCGYT